VVERDHIEYLNVNVRVISKLILSMMRTCIIPSSDWGYGQTASSVNTTMNLLVPQNLRNFWT